MSNATNIFISGNANRPLAERIAEYNYGALTPTGPEGAGKGQRFGNRHRDGEISVELGGRVRARDVFLIQPTGGYPNEYLMELFVLADAAKRASAGSVTAVIPYYAYARQDWKASPRTPITAKLVANLLKASGVDRVLTMDLHSPQIQGFFDIPVDALTAAPVFAAYLKATLGGKETTVVAPDQGGMKRADGFALRLRAGMACLGKERKSDTEVRNTRLVGDVKGKDCILLDDMTTTAGTLCEGAKTLKETGGARSVTALVSHCPLTADGVKRLTGEAGKHLDGLVTTDSLRPGAWTEGWTEEETGQTLEGVLEEGGVRAGWGPRDRRRKWMTGKIRTWLGGRITVLPIGGLFGEAINLIVGNESLSELF